ncbi:hypothetical protein RIVM261_009660 [Rivularia sp. IAM M-261]|nr:hypothetical protein CAL7716_068330 [Calothrix sp. PCC 7716]GJD16010.1 hypothetical protein RIVM261_009660 [Rivularia sp. IAM M-261]
MWIQKLIICLIYDFLDFTVGRVLFPIPFIGEIVGCIICIQLFGEDGVLYGLEAIDVTEQIDGFIPTATIIALKNKPN